MASVPIQYIPSHLLSNQTIDDVLINPNAKAENAALAKNYYPNFTVTNRPEQPLEIDIIGGNLDKQKIPLYLMVGAAVLLVLLLTNNKKKR